MSTDIHIAVRARQASGLYFDPVSPHAKALARLCRTKTLTVADLQVAKTELGCHIEVLGFEQPVRRVERRNAPTAKILPLPAPAKSTAVTIVPRERGMLARLFG